MSPATLGNGTLPRGPLHIPEGDDSWGPVPSTKLHAQVPTASGLTAFAHYSYRASIVGLELIVFSPRSAILAIKFNVFPSGGVFLRFQVSKKLCAGNCRAEVAFQLLKQVMAALNRPVSRHEDVQ